MQAIDTYTAEACTVFFKLLVLNGKCCRSTVIVEYRSREVAKAIPCSVCCFCWSFEIKDLSEIHAKQLCVLHNG